MISIVQITYLCEMFGMEFDTFIQHTKIANKICAKRGGRGRESGAESMKIQIITRTQEVCSPNLLT